MSMARLSCVLSVVEKVGALPTYAQAIQAVIGGGGDIEITAHNADRITVTLVEASGLRHVVFDNSRQTITQQKAA